MVKVREDYPLMDDGSFDIDNWLSGLAQEALDIEAIRRACEMVQACEIKTSQASKSASSSSQASLSQVSPSQSGSSKNTVSQKQVIAAKKDQADAGKVKTEANKDRAKASTDKNQPLSTIWSDQVSCFKTGLEMVQILDELQLDTSSLIAAVLYRPVREDKLSLTKVEKNFGKEVAKLVKGVLQMAAISHMRHPIQGSVLGQNQSQVDNIRRMLVTMVDDVRVALIKLAERTCAIRAFKNMESERRHRIAREVFDIYAPLAHRLGIGHLKWELEDLSFRYLHEKAYKKIARLLDERRLDRQKFIDDVLATLGKDLLANDIQAELAGRAKHIYSIWRKMHRKGIDFERVYDIRAIRILVPSVKDCYSALGIVHSLWRHIPHEFDDYIANPKENGYQSLHTAVVGPEGKVMEVQIRTYTMHEEAELGVCAHWRYKGHDLRQNSKGYENKIAWLRQVLEWQEELGAKSSDMIEQFRSNIISDRIYVFTPDGHVIDLPSGSTPIDFAYKVHTEIGHSCRGAKINGVIKPLNYQLKTGDQVNILTSNQDRPSRDWLNPDLGYTRTSRARAKITHWFKEQDRDLNTQEGRDVLTGLLKRLSLEQVSFEELAGKVNMHNAEDMFAAIGAGDIKPMHVAHIAQKLVAADVVEPVDNIETSSPVAATSGEVNILGVGNLMTQLANCCRPVPGDGIVGYITLGRGVSVHRKDCINALQLQSQNPDRIIEVTWGNTEQTYPVNIVVEAYDRPGLLRDITTLLANAKINVNSANTLTDKSQNTAKIRLQIEVQGIEKLSRLFDRVRQLPNIIDAKRDSSSH